MCTKPAVPRHATGHEASFAVWRHRALRADEARLALRGLLVVSTASVTTALCLRRRWPSRAACFFFLQNPYDRPRSGAAPGSGPRALARHRGALCEFRAPRTSTRQTLVVLQRPRSWRRTSSGREQSCVTSVRRSHRWLFVLTSAQWKRDPCACSDSETAGMAASTRCKALAMWPSVLIHISLLETFAGILHRRAAPSY